MNPTIHTYAPLQKICATLAIFALITIPMEQVFADDEKLPTEPLVEFVAVDDTTITIIEGLPTEPLVEFVAVDDTTITIIKETVPNGDTTTFNFTMDGVAFGSPIADGESTGPVVVSPGFHHMIDEIAVPGWTFVRDMEVSNCVDEENNVIGSFDGPYYLTLASGDDVVCTFKNTKDPVPVEVCSDDSAKNFGKEEKCAYHEDVENSCLIPSSKGDNSPFEIGISSEKPLQTILDEAGFGLTDVEGDQMNYQVWDFASDDTDSVAFTVTALSKNAGNVETFGYYKAGDITSFVPVFTIPPTDIGVEFLVTIPKTFAHSVGFAIQTAGTEPNTWYSEFGLNSHGKDNLAVYNPATNTYVLGFEDLQKSDNDYNDLVVEIEKVECAENETPICQTKENLLLNGSFEADVVTGHGGKWQIFASPLHWLVSLSNGLELWADGFYGGASEGDQNAELDGNSPTQISQTVPTIPGATYELRFDFSARPDADSSADNSVDALVEGNVIMNATANGSNITTNTWSTHAKTFVANDASTDIALRDIGRANSYGSLVDNVCLLKVEDAPKPMCELTIVSDGSTVVTGDEEESATLLMPPLHSGWTAVIPGASWIWSDNPVVDPIHDTTRTFVRGFNWYGGVESATFEIASDNSYRTDLNGAMNDDVSEDNYALTTQDVYDVTSAIEQGGNNLEIEVKNWAQPNSTSQTNPAGLLYKLTIMGSDPSCEPDVPTYTITGYKWHDLDKDGEKDENEPNLEGWTIEAEEDTEAEDPAVYTDVTNADGYYAIEVSRGTWIVSEQQKEGWIQTAPVDPNYCSFSFGQQDTRVSKTQESHMCNFGNYQRGGDNNDDPLLCSIVSDDYKVRRNQDFTLSWEIDALETDTVTYSWLSEGDASMVSPYTTSVTSDTTFTITLTRGEGEGAEVASCSVDIDVVRRSGGSGGGRRTPGEVRGDSTTRDSGGEVLGATTDMPVGAPNTGAGGTSPVVVTLPSIIAVCNARPSVQKST